MKPHRTKTLEISQKLEHTPKTREQTPKHARIEHKPWPTTTLVHSVPEVQPVSGVGEERNLQRR